MQVFKQFLTLMPHYFSTVTSSLIRLLFCWYPAGKEEGSRRLARRIRGSSGADFSSAWCAKLILFHFLSISLAAHFPSFRIPLSIFYAWDNELATSFLQLLQITALRLVSSSIRHNLHNDALMNELQFFGAYPVMAIRCASNLIHFLFKTVCYYIFTKNYNYFL